MNINELKTIGESRIRFLNCLENHIQFLNKPIQILETGAGHAAITDTQAPMTYIFAYLLKKYNGGKILTIDIDENNLNACKKNTENLSEYIDYKLGDSINCINNLDKNYIESLDLIFLDSYDLFIFDPKPSAIHHLKELLSLFEKINPNCWIAIDDNFLPNTWINWRWDNGKEEIFETREKNIGKGMFCHDFLIKNDWIREDSILVHGANNIFLYKSKKSL